MGNVGPRSGAKRKLAPPALCQELKETLVQQGYGFLVLRLSPMPVVQDFGIVTAMTVFFSLLLALGLLPILLVMDSTFERVLNGDSHDDS